MWGAIMILYTYAPEGQNPEERWDDTDMRDEFFTHLGDVRDSVLRIQQEVLSKDGLPWQPIQIERVEIEAVTEKNLLILLNEGIGPLVLAYEIVETVD